MIFKWAAFEKLTVNGAQSKCHKIDRIFREGKTRKEKLAQVGKLNMPKGGGEIRAGQKNTKLLAYKHS